MTRSITRTHGLTDRQLMCLKSAFLAEDGLYKAGNMWIGDWSERFFRKTTVTYLVVMGYLYKDGDNLFITNDGRKIIGRL